MRRLSRKAAHFLLLPELAGSPPNEAIVRSLQELGFDVDLFAPGELGETPYGASVGVRSVSYGRRWLLRHGFDPRWRQYSLFSGTSEDPLATMGALAFAHRRPSFALVDEIKSGSYYGDAPEYWKRICRWAMRRAAFCIVNDEMRIPLLREYASLPTDSNVLVYPGAFDDTPKAADRQRQRTAWGAPKDALVIGVSGGFNTTAGADWLIDALTRLPSLYLVMQPIGLDSFTRLLLRHLTCAPRMYVEEKRLSWREAWASAAALDVGLAIYTNPAPQFQRMGISSNRLCMFLSMGVPVIASRQPSFEFLERFDCGVMVASQREFDEALMRIRARLPEMRENALRCTREYIRPKERRAGLRDALLKVVG